MARATVAANSWSLSGRVSPMFMAWTVAMLLCAFDGWRNQPARSGTMPHVRNAAVTPLRCRSRVSLSNMVPPDERFHRSDR